MNCETGQLDIKCTKVENIQADPLNPINEKGRFDESYKSTKDSLAEKLHIFRNSTFN